MPVNNPRGAERGLVCRVGDGTALSCPPNKDGIFCWGGRKKPSVIDPEGALLTTRGRLASPTSAVRYIRREGRLWVNCVLRARSSGKRRTEVHPFIRRAKAGINPIAASSAAAESVSAPDSPHRSPLCRPDCVTPVPPRLYRPFSPRVFRAALVARWCSRGLSDVPSPH